MRNLGGRFTFSFQVTSAGPPMAENRFRNCRPSAHRDAQETCVGHELKREETNVRQMALAASLTSEYVFVFWFFEAKTAN